MPQEEVPQYSTSDRLGIALACLGGVVGIILYLVEKTPITITLFLVGILALVVFPVLHFAQTRKQRVVSFIAVIVALLLFGTSIWPKENKAKLVMRYQRGKLDGQTITLIRDIDPRLPSQPRMYIDPNYPTMFCIAGMSLENDGNETGEIQSAYLDFPTPVTAEFSRAWGWVPEGEASEFVANWNKTPISPHQPRIEMNRFCGSPIPKGDMKIRVRVFYGDSAEATFTLRPPS